MITMDMRGDASRKPSTGSRARPSFKRSPELIPAEIYRMLDEEVIGQDQAKKVLAVAVYNHLKRLEYEGPVRIEKSNILLIGPTGCGKTLLARTLAKVLEVPFVMGSATSLTEAGYVGEDVESLLTRLLQKAQYDVELAQRGVLFIDEVDKLVPKNPLEGVSTSGVQADLLKLLEGAEIEVPKAGVLKGTRSDFVTMDTSQILFICAGAFTGLENIIARRVKPNVQHQLARRKPGVDTFFPRVCPSDLIDYGILSELVGRLPVLVPMAPLTRQELKRVLTEPPSSLVKQYQELQTLDGVALTFDDDALESIAEAAHSEGAGARSLRRILEDVMTDLMFKLPSRPYLKTCQITRERVDECLGLRLRPNKRRLHRIGNVIAMPLPGVDVLDDDLPQEKEIDGDPE